jgi:uncharacterized protein
MERNPVGWCEIPVTDIARAKKFYSTVFLSEFKNMHMDMPEMEMWYCMHGDVKGAGIALIKHDTYKPSMDGVLIYFTSATNNLRKDSEVTRENGGEILEGVKALGKHGFMITIKDTEGNKIAIHTMVQQEE